MFSPQRNAFYSLIRENTVFKYISSQHTLLIRKTQLVIIGGDTKLKV